MNIGVPSERVDARIRKYPLIINVHTAWCTNSANTNSPDGCSIHVGSVPRLATTRLSSSTISSSVWLIMSAMSPIQRRTIGKFSIGRVPSMNVC